MEDAARLRRPSIPSTLSVIAAFAVISGLPATGLGQRAGSRRAIRQSERALEVERQAGPFAGRTVESVTIKCNTDRCRDPRHIKQLRRFTLIEPGDTVSPGRIAQAWVRLMKTGYFDSVGVELAETGASTPAAEAASTPAAEAVPARVTFDCKGNIVITQVKVAYAELGSDFYPKQLAKEIKKRLLLKKGGAYPDTDIDFLDKQRRKIIELYEREGYEGTQVKLVPLLVDQTGRRVHLSVQVDEGRQPWMGELLVAGNEALSYSRLTEPVTTGERVDFWEPLFGLFGIGKYDRRRLKTELAEVEQLYREAGHFAARVRLVDVLTHDDTVYPLIHVYEGPHVELAFEGNHEIKDRALAETCSFRAAGAFDQTEIEESRRAIEQAFEAGGRYFAHVTHTRETLAPGRERLTFHIDEGPRVYVKKIRIVGHRDIPTADLIAVMETRGVAEDGVVSAFDASSGVLQNARLINDLTAIRNLYRDRGFPAMRFRCKHPASESLVWTAKRRMERSASPDSAALSDLARGRFDVWSNDPTTEHCFLVERDADPRLVTVTIALTEGLRTTADRLDLGDFSAELDADTRDDLYDLLGNLGFVDDLRRWQSQTGFSMQKLDAVQGFIQRWYRNTGYLNVVVKPRCGDLHEPDRKCTAGALYGIRLEKLSFDILPGPQFITDGILIRGNLRTRNRIINDELLVDDGEPLGRDAVHLSKANLRSLGIFEAVRIDTLADMEPQQGSGGESADEARSAAILVTVEESDYRLLETGAGLQIDSAPLSGQDLPLIYLAQLGVRDRNFDGRALELGATFEHANRVDTPTDAQGDDATWKVGPFVRDRRFLRTRWSFTGQLIYGRDQTEQQDQYAVSYSAKTTLGYDFYQLSYPSPWGRGLRASISAEFKREERRNLTTPKGERPPFSPPNYSLSWRPGIRWDRRDNPLHPTRGWLIELISEVVFGSDAPLPSLLSPSFKETIETQYVYSLFKRRLVIAASLAAGAIQTDLDEADLKADFFFKAGGDGVPWPVRGYSVSAIEASGGTEVQIEDTEAVPLSVGGRAMGAGSLEVRWPTFIADDWWFATFADFAAVAEAWDQMDSDRIYPSAGVGVRWLITGQIPLRLDIGYPLRSTVFGDQEPRLHFNIFYSM